MKRLAFIGVSILFAAGVSFFIYQTGGDMDYEKVPLKTMADISTEKLASLSGKRIFFGHQSVGGGMMKGLTELAVKYPHIRLNIVETRALAGVDGPVFAHGRVGKNTQPRSKVDDFSALMDKELMNGVDIAFFKFCYADIGSKTDVRAVFDYYVAEMRKLEEKYPRVKFLHVTVPYYRRSGGIKGFIKWALDKDHNTRRDEFNRLLRSHYGAAELFDLGLYEATYPDGTIVRGDRAPYALAPLYTSDGGHLNEKGREAIASQFLYFLASHP